MTTLHRWRLALLFGTVVSAGVSGMAPAFAGTPECAYVTNSGSDTISVIDTATNRVTRTIHVSGWGCRTEAVPNSIALSWITIAPNGAFAYVTSGACILFKLETATSEISSFPSRGGGVAFTADSALAYAGDPGDNSIAVLNPATNAIADRIPLGRLPGALALTHNGAFLYVANPRDDAVSVVDTAARRVTSTIAVGAAPEDIVVSPKGTLVYLALDSDRVAAIDTSTNRIVATISVGHSSQGLAITPDGTRVYVTGDPVSVVDTRTNTVVATLPLSSFQGIAVTQDGAFVYVPNGADSVSVVSTATNAIVATITVPDCGLERDPEAPCVPSGVAIGPAPQGCAACGGDCTSDSVPDTEGSGCAIEPSARPHGLEIVVLLAVPFAFRWRRWVR